MASVISPGWHVMWILEYLSRGFVAKLLYHCNGVAASVQCVGGEDLVKQTEGAIRMSSVFPGALEQKETNKHSLVDDGSQFDQ